MGLNLRELRELPAEVSKLAGATREGAANHTNSAEFYRSLNKASTWEGRSGDTARAAMETSARDHETTAESLGKAARTIELAEQDAEDVAKEIKKVLDHAAEQPWPVEIDQDTNQVIAPDTSYLTDDAAADVAAKVADVQAEVAAVLAAGELVDTDLARAIAAATGTEAPDVRDSTPTPLPDGSVRRDDPARVRASAEAFEKVFGRLPTSPADWSTAESLNPNSYDPRFRGNGSETVGPVVKVVKIDPVPGQGVVRSSQFIEQRDVMSWPPGSLDIGNNRSTDVNFDPENTKVTTYIDFENGIVVLRQNPSVEIAENGDLGQVKVGTPIGEVWQTPDGAVRIKYDSANPFAPDIAQNPPWPLKDHPVSVTGDLVFTPQEGGIRVDGTRSDYPSLEVYQDMPDGTTNTVLIDPAVSGRSFGPGVNLPFHHDVGAGGSAFAPFDMGGYNPKYDVKVPLPSTPFGPTSSPPSVLILTASAQF